MVSFKNRTEYANKYQHDSRPLRVLFWHQFHNPSCPTGRLGTSKGPGNRAFLFLIVQVHPVASSSFSDSFVVSSEGGEQYLAGDDRFECKPEIIRATRFCIAKKYFRDALNDRVKNPTLDLSNFVCDFCLCALSACHSSLHRRLFRRKLPAIPTIERKSL
ncbi:MAG: hypothetical protein J0I23_23730 [Rhizobiales bacterium]|nr:hypothetical protein [Hyphomicrobiales bacterium]